MIRVPDIPHLAFPVRFADGVIVTVEQDAPGHLRDRIHVTCRTVIGERLDDPTFGIPDDVLRANEADLGALTTALAESEPEITVVVHRPSTGDPDPPGLPLPRARDDVRIDIQDQEG